MRKEWDRIKVISCPERNKHKERVQTIFGDLQKDSHKIFVRAEQINY